MILFLTFAFFLLSFNFALAQVAIDGTPTSSGVVGAATLTFSKTISGANRYLAVGVTIGGDDVTSVTFNGVSLTLKTNFNIDGGTPGRDVALYELIAPAATTANVVISTAVADGCGGACTNIAAGAISFNGVNQTTPSGTAQTSNDFFNTPATVTVAANKMALSVIGQSDCDVAGVNPTDEQVGRWDICADPSAIQSAGATTTTNGTLPWSDATGYKGQIAIVINEATAAAGVARRRIINQ